MSTTIPSTLSLAASHLHCANLQPAMSGTSDGDAFAAAFAWEDIGRRSSNPLPQAPVGGGHLPYQNESITTAKEAPHLAVGTPATFPPLHLDNGQRSIVQVTNASVGTVIHPLPHAPVQSTSPKVDVSSLLIPFQSRTECVNACKAHAKEKCHSHHLLQDNANSGSRKITLTCSTKSRDLPGGCSLEYVLKNKKSVWSVDINKCNFSHNKPCESKHKTTKSELLKEDKFIALAKASQTSQIGPKAAHKACKEMGENVSLFTVADCLKAARSIGKEEYDMIYALLDDYLKQVADLNDATKILVARNDDSTFKWAVLVMGQSAEILSQVGLEVVGLDAQASKNAEHKYQSMTIVGVVPLGKGKEREDCQLYDVIFTQNQTIERTDKH